MGKRTTAKCKTAEGLNYCINQEKYLKVFLREGDTVFDNNATEGALRGFCIGKNNWKLIDTIDGAKLKEYGWFTVYVIAVNIVKKHEFKLLERIKLLSKNKFSFDNIIR